LKLLGAEAQAAAPSIVELLREGDTRLQDPAASAIAAICGGRPCSPHAAAAIVESFGRGPGPRDHDARYQALGILADSAMPYLNAALGDARPQLRRQALLALGRLSEGWGLTSSGGKTAGRRVDLARLYCAGREAMSRIVAFLDDTDPDVRGDAERALLSITGLAAACPELRAILSRDASRSASRGDIVARLLAQPPPRLWIASLDSIRIESAEGEGAVPPRRADGGADTQAVSLTLPIHLSTSLSELGTVRLAGSITSEGLVSGVRVLESPVPEFARVCASAVRNLRYVPGTVGGRKKAFPFVATCRSRGD
jgi:hypothetical protein